MEKVITWGEPKRQANIAKHGLDFADLTFGFFDKVSVDMAREGRKVAIGKLDDGTTVVIFVELGKEALSVISMRPASKKERMRYEGI